MLRSKLEQLKSELHQELKLRYKEYLESKLAVELLRQGNHFSSVKQISAVILKFMEQNNNKVVQIIKSNPSILAELREPYFGSCYDAKQEVTPTEIFEKICKILKDKNANLNSIMQIHCIFVYRIYDHLEKKIEKAALVKKIFPTLLFSKENRSRIEKNPKSIKATTQFGITRHPVFCKLLGQSQQKHLSALEKYELDPSTVFFKAAKEKSLPIVCGPSGHAGSLMLGAKLYGNLSSEQLKEYAMISFAFFAAAGNHSFYEVMLIAELAGAEVVPHNYAASMPYFVTQIEMYRKLKITFSQFLTFDNSGTTNMNSHIQPEAVIKIIQDSRSLVKTICSPLGENRSWDEILPEFIKNKTCLTPTTLLPVDGMMHLFEPENPKYQDMVGMLFDLTQCDIEYVFPTDANSKRWLNKEDGVVPQQTTLDQLKVDIDEARKKNIVPSYNEILARLSLNAMVAVFSTKDMLFDRLNALAKQNLIKKLLKKDLPILVITDTKGISIYQEQDRIRDIEQSLLLDKTNPSRILVEKYIDAELIKRNSLIEHKDEKLFVTSKNNNNDFFSDPFIPQPLKLLTLEYIDFASITYWAHEIPTHKEDKITNELMIEVFNKRKFFDLTYTEMELKQPLEEINVLKIMKEETLSWLLIERTIIHVCWLNPVAASKIFVEYSHLSGNKINQNIILTFLKCCTDLPMSFHEKGVAFIESEDWGYPPEVINMKKWTPLLNALLIGNPTMANLIYDHYPNEIANILAGLDELQEISKKYLYDCIYSAAQITQAREKLQIAECSKKCNKESAIVNNAAIPNNRHQVTSVRETMFSQAHLVHQNTQPAQAEVKMQVGLMTKS